jgi:L-ascorbate metabolism protein UlaG (beta-lactamase superfamily)
MIGCVLTIQYLNHASVLVREGSLALLSDPWYRGSAFSGGWGLQYETPEAIEVASQADQLWISHWHSDHMHAPTLAELARRRPDMQVLANVSANFSLVRRLRELGFRDLRPLRERDPMTLDGDGAVVERFPTAGIDNALLVRTPNFTLLNYNDCNLPARAIGALKRRIGRIDVLLCSYNHAGKLFETHSVDEEKRLRCGMLRRTVELFEPAITIPFASSHYYRSPFSREQNQSLLGFDELEALAASVPGLSVLRIGERMTLGKDADPVITRIVPGAVLSAQQVHEYGASVPWKQLLDVAVEHARALKAAFPLLSRFTGELVVDVEDHGRVLLLDCKRGTARPAPAAARPHIAAHSQGLFDWLGRPFGADTFAAGAHFALRSADTRVIQRWTLLTLLAASHMSERDALGYITSREGLWFLWCRREEILATLRSGQLKAGQARLS